MDSKQNPLIITFCSLENEKRVLYTSIASHYLLPQERKRKIDGVGQRELIVRGFIWEGQVRRR